MILKDKSKNKIRDKTVKDIKIRFQLVRGFPSKELRSFEKIYQFIHNQVKH